ASMNARKNSKTRRLCVAGLAFLGVTTAGSTGITQEKFQKLTAGQNRAKLAGMELTDNVHWRDLLQRNGTVERRRLIIGAAIGSVVVGVAALVSFAGHYAIFNDDDDDDDDDQGRDAVVRALRFAKVSLQQGLAASEQEGQPISGKFEVDRGKFQLSVY